MTKKTATPQETPATPAEHPVPTAGGSYVVDADGKLKQTVPPTRSPDEVLHDGLRSK